MEKDELWTLITLLVREANDQANELMKRETQEERVEVATRIANLDTIRMKLLERYEDYNEENE